MKRNPQTITLIILAVLACAALYTTYQLVVSAQSGRNLTASITQLSERMTPPAEPLDEADNAEPSADNQPPSRRPDRKPDQANPSPPDLAVARIKEKNMFVAPVQPDFRTILGILGDQVLYPGGKSLGVGDTHNGSTIKEIGSNWVKVEYEGEIIALGVYGGTPPPDPEPEPDPAADTEDASPTENALETDSDAQEAPGAANADAQDPDNAPTPTNASRPVPVNADRITIRHE